MHWPIVLLLSSYTDHDLNMVAVLISSTHLPVEFSGSQCQFHRFDRSEQLGGGFARGPLFYFNLQPIDGFHGDVIRLQSQKSEVLRILIYTRLKINRKYIFVQVSSTEACFISKIQQFELPSFHSA